jgi:hypothetical protein
MKNDITRDTFDTLKYFTRVLMQQGRVQLDADWNEQVSILLHYLRTLAADLIGPSAGPEAAWGFKLLVSDPEIKALPLASDDENKLIERRKMEQVLIAPGRYYVDGLLVENDRFASFFQQPPGLTPDEAKKKAGQTLDEAKKGKGLIIYLDVWERHITWIDDDDILEKALSGPDTATRAKTTWIVRAREMRDEERAAVTPSPTGLGPVPSEDTAPPPGGTLPLPEGTLRPARNSDSARLHIAFDNWGKAQWKNRGLLRAGIEEQAESDDPCVSSPESGYRGMENQLYRVEIHRPGTGWDDQKSPATFKWSRDNGSVVVPWLDDEDEILKVSAVRDRRRGFTSGQWVELSDDRSELEAVPGTLVQLKEAESGSLTIDPATAPGPFARENFPHTPKVRRWDQEETEAITLDEGAIPIKYDKWFALEDGVQVQFPRPLTMEEYEFRSGDYWLIPARVATRDIEWPWEIKDGKKVRRALPPHGVDHHYALLGVLSAPGTNFEFKDLRRTFPPLREVHSRSATGLVRS